MSRSVYHRGQLRRVFAEQRWASSSPGSTLHRAARRRCATSRSVIALRSSPMDEERFDTLVRSLPVAASRRAVGHSVAAAVFGGVMGVLGLAEAGAHGGKRGGKKHGGKKHGDDDHRNCPSCNPLDTDAPCTSNRQCCPNETNRICSRVTGAVAGDPTTCCGGLNAGCGSRTPGEAPLCCTGFVCSNSGPGGTGTCKVAP